MDGLYESKEPFGETDADHHRTFAQGTYYCEQSRLSGNRSGLYDAVLLRGSQRETNGKQSGAILGETSDCVGIIPDVLLRSKRAAVPAELICREIEPHVESTVGYLVDQEQRTQPICRTFLQYLERAVESCDSVSKTIAGQT